MSIYTNKEDYQALDKNSTIRWLDPGTHQFYVSNGKENGKSPHTWRDQSTTPDGLKCISHGSLLYEKRKNPSELNDFLLIYKRIRFVDMKWRSYWWTGNKELFSPFCVCWIFSRLFFFFFFLNKCGTIIELERERERGKREDFSPSHGHFPSVRVSLSDMKE